MSNSASLAAAKKRRGVSQSNSNPQLSNSSSSGKNINRINSEPTIQEESQRIHPLQILGFHENRLEFLEKAHNNMAMALNKYPNPNEDKIITNKDLEEFKEAFQKISSKNSDLVKNIGKKENMVQKEEMISIITNLRNEIQNEFSNLNGLNDNEIEQQLNSLKKSVSEQYISNNNFDKVRLDIQKTISNLENKLSTDVQTIKSSIDKSIKKEDLDDLRSEFNKTLENKISNSNTIKSNTEKNSTIDTSNFISGKQLDELRSEILETIKAFKNTTENKINDNKSADVSINETGSIMENFVKKEDFDKFRNEIVDLLNTSENDNKIKTLFADFNSLKEDVSKSLESAKKTNGKTNGKANDEKVTLSFKLRLDELENKVLALEQIMVTK